jgi:hypothetical protein
MTSWRDAHRQRVMELEEEAAAVMMAALGPILDRAAASLGTVTAASPAEARVSTSDLDRVLTDWRAAVDKEVLPYFGGIFHDGAEAAADQVAGIGVVVPAPDREFLDAAAVRHLSSVRDQFFGVGEQAWEAARGELLAGFREGEGIDELRRRVQGATGEARSRAEAIARTNVIGAANMGAAARVDQMGDAAPPFKQWLSTMDARTRPTHVRADGQVVPRQQSFDVGGARLRVPGDPSGPAHEVINCRCTTLYLDTDQAIDIENRQEGGDPESAAGLQQGADTPGIVDLVADEDLAPDVIGPTGRPVSAAVDIDAQDAAFHPGLRKALDAIDSVHGDGDLKSIIIEPTNRGYYARGGEEIGLVKGRSAAQTARTMIHEVGHWLDNQALPVGTVRRDLLDMATESVKTMSSTDADANPIADALFDLTAKLRRSPAVKGLEAKRKAARAAGNQEQVTWYKYLTEETEVFARAYYQWVTLRSGDRDLLEDLVKFRDEYGGDPVQWSDEEFLPLAAAFDDYFRAVGWISG